ncbi:MAG: O-methyltransferase [Acidobacteria bacterium]|jgi:predicted O-methyltransferase YrrM|nr:O-methyltransferase [Acidobacteriota bacterium]
MKQKFDAILQPEQAIYLDNLLPESKDILAEMEQYAAEHNIPIADREVAWFLEITARAMNAKKCLEIGLAIGYGAAHLANGIGDESGKVLTIEPSEEMIEKAQNYLARLDFLGKIEIVKGTALDVLPHLLETFDLVYLDAVKEEYADYLELCLPLLRVGGVIIADNLLWGGQVAGEIHSDKDTTSTLALRDFNKKFINHPQLKAQILSVGDGLGYGVKIK